MNTFHRIALACLAVGLFAGRAEAATVHCSSLPAFGNGFEALPPVAIDVQLSQCTEHALPSGEESVAVALPLDVTGAPGNATVEIWVDGSLSASAPVSELEATVLFPAGNFHVTALVRDASGVALASSRPLGIGVHAGGSPAWNLADAAGRPFQPVVLTLHGAVNVEETLQASLAGVPITLHAADGNAVVGAVPNVEPGIYTLEFDSASLPPQSLPFEVLPALALGDPRTYVESRMLQARNDMQNALIDPEFGTAEDRADAERLISAVNGLWGPLNSLSDEDAEILAQVLDGFPEEAAASATAASSKAASCTEAAQQWNLRVVYTGTRVGLIANYGLAVLKGLVTPVPVSSSVPAIAMAVLVIEFKLHAMALVKRDFAEFVEWCAVSKIDRLIADLTGATGAKAAQTIHFENGELLGLEVESDVTLDRSLAEAALNQLRSTLAHLRALLTGALADLALSVPPADQATVVADPIEFRVTAFNGTDLAFNAAPIAKHFNAVAVAELSPQAFVVRLERLSDNHTTDYPAELSGEFPQDCDHFTHLVPGSWAIGKLGDIPYQAEAFADGTMNYYHEGQTYPSRWRVLPVSDSWHSMGVEPGCVMSDSGFWHPAYDGLVRSNLTIPLTGFAKYDLGGPWAWPPEGNYWGYDLSTEPRSVVYTKN